MTRDSVKFAITILLTIGSGTGQNCPKCSPSMPCVSSLTQADCPAKEYIVKDGSLCGCCPGCQSGTEFGYYCDSSGRSSCAPGLICQADKCVLNKKTCAYTYHLSNLKVLPTCEVDGTFAAVQCKGDRIMGRCFCYSETGDRIFGWAWRRESAGMTCACSRKKFKLIQEGYIENTLHCDQMGNFEPLQCSNGVCWCADVKTGEVLTGTRAVPESLWTFLPCYDVVKMGLSYLRQCESAAFAQHLMEKTLVTHGTTNVEFKKIICDYDGSYGIYYVSGGAVICQWRDGNRIGSFQASSNTISRINCNCARDQKIFEEAGLTHTLACNGNGNYEYEQDINGKMFCVDRDGFAVTDAVQTESALDCKRFIYYEVTDIDTDEIDNENADNSFMSPDYQY